MSELYHWGVKGQRWGIRRWQNPDGSLTPEGRAHYLGESSVRSFKNQTVFVSGSSKTQDKTSGYYRKKLPSEVRYELHDHMKRGDKIIVGDAPGIDRQVQDYLAKKRYTNVEVFSPGKEGARYLANKGWKQTNVDKPGAEIGSKEWLAAKDFVMSNLADKGIAVTIDEGAKATRKNVDRLVEANKEVLVYELGKDKGFVRNLLGLRGDKATTFVNGKEVPEDYDFNSFDTSNPYGDVPKHEYGTRTKAIAANKIAEEKQKAYVNSAKEAIAELKFRDSDTADDSSYNRYARTLGPFERLNSDFYRRENKKDYKRFARQASASIKSLRASGHTMAEIAKMLGVSESTVSKYANL